MSILLPWIAPPLSSTVYVWPFITTLVPNANVLGAAIVRFAVAFVPDAVIPFVFPQHLTHAQYAVTLYLPDEAVVVPENLELDLDVTFVWIWTILFTGSFITFDDSSILSISTPSLYFSL